MAKSTLRSISLFISVIYEHIFMKLITITDLQVHLKLITFVRSRSQTAFSKKRTFPA